MSKSRNKNMVCKKCGQESDNGNLNPDGICWDCYKDSQVGEETQEYPRSYNDDILISSYRSDLPTRFKNQMRRFFKSIHYKPKSNSIFKPNRIWKY